ILNSLGKTIPSSMKNSFHITMREPLGVVGIITPWNFPFLIPGWKIVPAIATGGMGLSAVAIASAMGIKVIGIDINEGAVERAKKIGAISTYSYKDKNELNKIVEDITKSFGLVDAIFDTTGNPDAISPLLPVIRPQGTLLMAGLMMKGKEILPLPADLVVAREIRIQGVLMLPAQKYDGIFKLMGEGKINLDGVIYKYISLWDVNDAYKEMSEFKNIGRIIINKFK
ncbi:hypothetical protein DJ523_07000, partial [Sulfolobus sp. E5]